MGWIVSASGNGYLNTVKNANQVNFVGIDGISVTGEDVGDIRTITAKVNVDNITTEITYKADGYEKLYRQKDGSYNTKRDGSGKKLTAEELKDKNLISQISAITPMVNGETVNGIPNLVNSYTTTLNNTPEGIKVEVNTGEITPQDDGTVTSPVANLDDLKKRSRSAPKAAQQVLATAPDSEKPKAQEKVKEAEDALNDTGINKIATAQKCGGSHQ